MCSHDEDDEDRRQLISTLCQANGVLLCVLSACRDDVQKPIFDAIWGATTLIDAALALARRDGAEPETVSQP